MARGIIYVMSSCVDGLVKIGKTNLEGFEQRMSHIERDGYHRIGVLKREFAIEVEDYDEKEKLLHEIFSKSRVGESELFSVDLSLVKQLMSSLEGRVIYPKDEEKDSIFEQATEEVEIKNGVIPNGIYTMETKLRESGEIVKATMEVANNQIYLKAGSTISTTVQKKKMGWMKDRKSLVVVGNVIKEDYLCTSPSMAAAIVSGHNKNGWESWKNSDGDYIDIYRSTVDNDD